MNALIAAVAVIVVILLIFLGLVAWKFRAICDYLDKHIKGG